MNIAKKNNYCEFHVQKKDVKEFEALSQKNLQDQKTEPKYNFSKIRRISGSERPKNK